MIDLIIQLDRELAPGPWSPHQTCMIDGEGCYQPGIEYSTGKVSSLRIHKKMAQIRSLITEIIEELKKENDVQADWETIELPEKKT